MNQHGFEDPGWTADEEVPIAVVTDDSNCLEQIGHIVAEIGDGWRSFKNIGNTFFDLQLARFPLTAWVSMSKTLH